MLIITGEKDHITPRATQDATYKSSSTTGVTETVEVPHRGHALTIDGA